MTISMKGCPLRPKIQAVPTPVGMVAPSRTPVSGASLNACFSMASNGTWEEAKLASQVCRQEQFKAAKCAHLPTQVRCFIVCLELSSIDTRQAGDVSRNMALFSKRYLTSLPWQPAVSSCVCVCGGGLKAPLKSTNIFITGNLFTAEGVSPKQTFLLIFAKAL